MDRILEGRGSKKSRGWVGRAQQIQVVVVVYHFTIVAIGHGLLKKFWPFMVYHYNTPKLSSELLSIHPPVIKSIVKKLI